MTKGHAFDAAVPALVVFRVADELGMRMAKGPTSLRMHLVVDAVTSCRFEQKAVSEYAEDAGGRIDILDDRNRGSK
ncbi:hypothetical protein KIW84_060489 [Lathyrus oleraceus]|uniref:Uncharacterized protein n=1 Tax=Pisum sativum TaxID=3888 RepID=A0A9D4W0A2_PEA|nr:hypothetical protein KIW84_060489 [Pisum sativum]